jgi:catecholate siderophore receptor
MKPERGGNAGREWRKNIRLIDNYYRFQFTPCQAPKPGLPLKEAAFAYASARQADAKIIAMQIILIYISPLAIAAPDVLHHHMQPAMPHRRTASQERHSLRGIHMTARPRFNLKPLSAAVLTAVAALAAPHAARAQTAAPAAATAPADQALPQVNVGATRDDSIKADAATVIKGQPQALRDIPQTINVVNRALMDSQGATSLNDALRNVPGITIAAAEGGTIGNNINLRGFSARTDIYLDGVRDRGQYFRDLFSLDAIEVLKGPSSMLFGRGSTGGVINQVPKMPSLKSASEITATTGTNREYRVTGDFNKALSDTSAGRMAIMYQDVPSTRNTMENKDFGIAPSITTGIGTPTEINLSALLIHNHDMPDYGLPPVNGKPAQVNEKNYYGINSDRTVQDVVELRASVKQKIDDNWKLRNTTSFSRYNIDVIATGPNNVGTITGGVYTPFANVAFVSGNGAGNPTNLPLSSLAVQLASHDRKIEDQSVFNTLELSGDVGPVGFRHSVLMGLEVGRDSYNNAAASRNLPVVSLTDPTNILLAASTAPIAAQNVANASAVTIAPYINDTITLTKWLKLVGGVRYDTYNAQITNTVPSATVAASASQKIHFTSVRTGVIVQPTDAQSYYVSYGTSFDPSIESLTVTSGQQNLAPETNKSYEIGGKWDLYNGNMSINTALFQVEKDNARSQVSTGVYTLTGNIQVRGGEFGIAGRITKNWQIYVNYALLNAKIISASALDGSQGKVPANVPRNSASVWTSYKITPKYEIGGGGYYMSNRYASNTDVVSVGNFVRFDAMAAYHYSKSVDFRLNLLNITNRPDNYDLVIASDGGRAAPTMARTLLGTVAYRF